MSERTSASRGQRLYDWRGEHAGLYRIVDRLSRPIRRRAVEALELQAGATVLDVGCGPGGSFTLLGEAVGPPGRVIGVDYSATMTRRARARGSGPADATVLRADAGTLPIRSGSVDAALASLALSAMPDARAALEEVRRVLREGARLAVVDGRVPEGPLRRPLVSAYARVANWQDVDVEALLRAAFPDVEVVATYDAGLAFVAVAEA